MTTILGDDTGSRLFWGIREAGLAESAEAEVLSFDGVGMAIASATTTPELAHACYDALQRELTRLQDAGVDGASWRARKRSWPVASSWTARAPIAACWRWSNSWLSIGRLETLDDVVDKVEAVSERDIRELLDRLPLTGTQVVATMGPLDERALFGSG